jgi:hypothetical protein
MRNTLRAAFFFCAFGALCQAASGSPISYDVTLDTAPLVGHPAGPFYVEVAFTDGGGVDDANNTITLSNIQFAGGSAHSCLAAPAAR